MPKLKQINIPTDEQQEEWEQNVLIPDNIKGIERELKQSAIFTLRRQQEYEELKRKRLEKEALKNGKKIKNLKPKEEKDKFTKFLSSNKRSHDEIEKWLLKNHYDPSKDTDLHKKQDERTKLIKMRDDAKTILHIIEREESKM
jgi:hypothetical protein